MLTVGAKLLSSILGSERPTDVFVRMQLKKDFFKDEERKIFTFVEDYITNYGGTPSDEAIKNETGIELPKTTDSPEYFLAQVETRHKQTVVKKTLLDANGMLKAKNPDQALELMAKTVVDLTMSGYRTNIQDFRDAAEVIANEYRNAKDPNAPGVRAPWPSLDEMMGKLVPGDIMVIAGRPGQGKTYLSLDFARHVWYTQKKRVMLVSMEMKIPPIFQRLASMQERVNQRNLRLGQLPDDVYTGMMSGLVDLKDHPSPLWVVDGNLTAKVRDIALLARQLEPDLVIVDGAYMLEPSQQGMSDWVKVKDTCESLKKVIASHVPVIASYQFNRASVKKSKGSKTNSEAKEDTGIEHLAGADAIGQIASVVLGLFEDDAQGEEGGVSDIDQKTVRILKGRNGEKGEFDINWRFKDPNPMDFSEITNNGVYTRA